MGAKLYDLRLRKAIEADSICNAIRYSPSHLYAVERGDAMPSLRMLVRLAAFYDTTLEYLAGHMVAIERDTDH